MLRQIIKGPIAKNFCQVKNFTNKAHYKASPSSGSQTNKIWYLAFGSLTLATALGAAYTQAQNRILLDSTEDPIKLQKLQVKEFRDNLKVFIWGDNTNLVVSPNDKTTEFFKTPQSFEFFDNCALRDLKLGKTSAAAVDINGDVYQWGLGYFGPKAEDYTPKCTLKGWNVKQVELTDDKLICLTTSGQLFLMPSDNMRFYDLPKKDTTTSGWLGTYSPKEGHCIELKLPNLQWGEKITELATGNHHLAIITSAGRLLTLATDPEGTQFGQTGVLQTEVYKFNEPPFLDKTLKFKKLGCGSNHTIVASSSQRLFGFGMNDLGQLGLGEFKLSQTVIKEPIELPSLNMKIDSIHLGGDNSIINAGNNILVFGFGQFGQLGNGQFVHYKSDPQQINQLSNKFYWDDVKKTRIGLNFSQISVGNSHSFFVLDSLPGNGEDWGRSVYTIGRNHCGQLGNDKRSNCSQPITLPSLLPSANNSIHLQLPYTKKLSVQTPEGKISSRKVFGNITAGFNTSGIYFKLD